MSEVLHVEVGKGSKNVWRFERLAEREKNVARTARLAVVPLWSKWHSRSQSHFAWHADEHRYTKIK